MMKSLIFVIEILAIILNDIEWIKNKPIFHSIYSIISYECIDFYECIDTIYSWFNMISVKNINNYMFT